MARFTVTKEIEIPFINESGEEDYDYVEVDFKVEASYGNLGIGSYEYWGMRGYDEQMGWELEDIEWDKSKYTPEVNAVIEASIEKIAETVLDNIGD